MLMSTAGAGRRTKRGRAMQLCLSTIASALRAGQTDTFSRLAQQGPARQGADRLAQDPRCC